MPRRSDNSAKKAPLFWLVRRVEVIRGKMPLRVEVRRSFSAWMYMLMCFVVRTGIQLC